MRWCAIFGRCWNHQLIQSTLFNIMYAPSLLHKILKKLLVIPLRPHNRVMPLHEFRLALQPPLIPSKIAKKRVPSKKYDRIQTKLPYHRWKTQTWIAHAIQIDKEALHSYNLHFHAYASQVLTMNWSKFLTGWAHASHYTWCIPLVLQGKHCKVSIQSSITAMTKANLKQMSNACFDTLGSSSI